MEYRSFLEEDMVLTPIEWSDGEESRSSLPVEIVTELENTTEQQQIENFKRFRKECKKYELDEWTIPERINNDLYKEISKYKTETSDIISKIYKISDTTRFQAKVAAEIYEQLKYVLEQSKDLAEAQTILSITNEQSNTAKKV
ncbi:hypothetical protein INT45_012479, partial [Circinella minor]